MRLGVMTPCLRASTSAWRWVGARHRLDNGLVDLAGNVAEWAADRWNREHEACWGVGVFVDPVCDTPSAIDPAGRTIRGGHYESLELGLRAAVRARVFNEIQAVSALVGFRCAIPLVP